MEQSRINIFLKAFAAVLRRERRSRRLTQQELARMAGKSVRYVSFLETNRHQPTLETLKLLSDALGLSVSSFLKKVEDEAEKSNVD
ncbi:helix-turn-helix domain-containing protein [Ruegeria denitrificans]|uniref:helix-turn-helix domain-containing protein n=1 Tax=Ruegeria denitrificans TaxID=1715692 RepID=UPI0009E6F28C|nr:helix-turn-helix transcriptional regulator [Ruegeria denitrificans]